MNPVAISPHGLLHHTTAAHHSTSDYNSHHSLHLRHTHSHPPLHQSHSCHQSLISPDCLTTPAPHSHTHTYKQHTSMHSGRSLVLALADISERCQAYWLLSLCLTPDCPTLELWTWTWTWTCACDPDFCLVLFASLPCLWYSCFCLLTFACLLLPRSNKYLTANGSTRLWPVITILQCYQISNYSLIIIFITNTLLPAYIADIVILCMAI